MIAPFLLRLGFALVALCLSVSPAFAAGPITYRIDVFGFAGVHVLELHGRTEESAGRYSVALNFATQGLAKVFVDLTTRVQVSGHFADGVAMPDQYRNASRRNGVERRSQLDYRPSGAVAAAVEPPPPDPVAPQRVRDTVDNLTAYFRLERQLGRGGGCAMTAHVYDGRNAYDLVFSDLGPQMLAPSGGQNFSGRATACRMERRIWPGMTNPEADEGARSGTLWYARLIPGDLMVPVRTRMDTQLGVVEGYMAELHADDANLTLMP